MFTPIGFFRTSGGGAFSATGGVVSTVGSYTVHLFTSSSNFVVTGNRELEIFLVGRGGEGGKGGFQKAGGGGGGGAVISSSLSFSTNTYGIRVGGGGSIYGTTEDYSAIQLSVSNIIVSASAGGNGGSDSQFSLTYTGNGSSGGAGGPGGPAAASGIYGNDGANSKLVSGRYLAGGGGGAGAAGPGGGDGAYNRGGVGIANDWLGSTTYYGGGGTGGRATDNTNVGVALGGGGNGGRSFDLTLYTEATSGSANTGGGGGGNTLSDTRYPGGSGIVIIRYLTNP